MSVSTVRPLAGGPLRRLLSGRADASNFVQNPLCRLSTIGRITDWTSNNDVIRSEPDRFRRRARSLVIVRGGPGRTNARTNQHSFGVPSAQKSNFGPGNDETIDTSRLSGLGLLLENNLEIRNVVP